MIKIYLRNIIRFAAVVLIQVLVFDNIELSGYINPYIYIIFIILLPFETPNWLLLTLAFLLGLSIDMFSMTYGMHASATVFAAFLRPFVLKNFSPRDGYEPGTFPRVAYYGFNWFAKYALILIFAHHFFLFFIEIFRISDVLFILSKTLLSGIVSAFFIIISQYFIDRR